MLVRIEKNPDGSHTFLSGGRMDGGWAFVPENIAIPDTFPFVDIQVENVQHKAVTQTKKYRRGSVIMEETVTVRPAFARMEVVAMTASQPVSVTDPEPDQLSPEERLYRLEQAVETIRTAFSTHFGTAI